MEVGDEVNPSVGSPSRHVFQSTPSFLQFFGSLILSLYLSAAIYPVYCNRTYAVLRM